MAPACARHRPVGARGISAVTDSKRNELRLLPGQAGVSEALRKDSLPQAGMTGRVAPGTGAAQAVVQCFHRSSTGHIPTRAPHRDGI